MIEIVKAPGLATVQDFGFPKGRAWGLPSGGAMDPFLLGFANRMAGNPPNAAAIEWAMGPGALRSDVDTRIAILGLAGVCLDDHPLDPPALAFTAPAGVTVSIAAGEGHRFSYVAVAGGIAVPKVLGSRSTYLPGGIGGHEGRRLHAGDRLPVGGKPPRPSEEFLVGLAEPRGEQPLGEVTLRVTRGPQWARFTESAREKFFGGRYFVSTAADRMGYRLNGPPIHPREKASFPSEAACPGAVQIPDGGQPIVLMPDGPTVGGYPKLAVVVRADLRKLAQAGPERAIRFREVSLSEARACYSEVP